MNRRDILKLFGVGAVIAPIASGSPILAAQCSLVETPKLHILPPQVAEATMQDMHEMFQSMEEFKVTISRKDGTSLDATAFIAEFNFSAPISGFMETDVRMVFSGPITRVSKVHR